jgi:hypothetical protein
VGRFWWPSSFDATRGFPGEGPPFTGVAPLPIGTWLRRAARVLTGDEALPHQPWITDGLSDEAIHNVLVEIASRGNSARPIAARCQSHPARVAGLLGADDPTAIQAAQGCAYTFHHRPYQYRRPRPIRLAAYQTAAAAAEIDRLMHKCGAVELAPAHDLDKALRPDAAVWERRPLRGGGWPAEKVVPVLSSDDAVREYDRDCLRSQVSRRAQGKPFRDFESTVFTVPKKDGRFRLCTDYRPLNEFQTKRPFKMENVQTVAETIQQGDFGMLVDLTDCYLTMGLPPSQRKYCRFRHPVGGQRLQWTTISFGMSEAPRICTKLLRPLIGLLKQLGIRCIIYIDDLLILHQDRTRLARGMAIAMDLLQRQVGLDLKTSKCSFRPSQQFTCLGFLWDTAAMRVAVPRARLWEAQRTAQRLLKVSGTPIHTRDLARFVGKITAMTRGIRGARRRLVHIQQPLGTAVREGGFTGRVLLSTDTISALQWWTGPEPWARNGSPIVPESRRLQGSVQSDAATESSGWGGTLTMVGRPTLSTRGHFTESERSLHINALELLGCWYTIRSLLPLAVPQHQWHDVHLSCELDSVVAIKYATVACSRSIKMSKVGARFFDWRERTKLQMSCRHLRGIYNVEADALSRQEWGAVEWRLDPGFLHRILKHWRCRIRRDLFASRQNTQSPCYFSWEHDFEAVGVDSLAHHWKWRDTSYAYPPAALLQRVLQKVIYEEVADLVLITPLFPSATWWPTLLQVSTTPPLVFPRKRWLTTDPLGKASWIHAWPLVAWRISGDIAYARECRQKTRDDLYDWQLLRQIRLLIGSGAHLRHEGALLRAATHDTFFGGID